MNPLEDRLQEYLSQFDDEPEMAPSLKRRAYMEQQLARAGIVPTNSIELPTNMNRELHNNLLTEGEDAMMNLSPPTRVRIYSHITQSRFLHIEDALAIGKLRLFGGNYRKGEGMNAYANAFVSIADARVIFRALACGEQDFNHKEYKGTPPQARPEQGRRNGNGAVSRILSIAIKGENVYIELKTGPGKLTNTGAITPNGPAKVEVNVGFKLYEARRMAASVLAYIHAWDVMRMMVNQQMVGKPAPYLLVAATSEANGVQPAPTKPANGTGKLPVAANGRPVTRKDPVAKVNGAATRQTNGQPMNVLPTVNGPMANSSTTTPLATDSTGLDTQPFKYGDGSTVNESNLTEVQTFQRYVAEKEMVPASRDVLLTYYRQQAHSPTSVAS